MSTDDFNPLVALPQATAVLLFSESNSRFLCEVAPEVAEEFEKILAEIPHALVGEVTSESKLEIVGIPMPNQDYDQGHPDPVTAPLVIDAELAQLKEAWQLPLRW